MNKHPFQFNSIIDVREEWEFKQNGLPGAMNVPVTFLALRLAELRKLPRPLLVYSSKGERSKKAFQILEVAGMDGIINLGGISAT